MASDTSINPGDVAVIGLAGRFPGCAGTEDFWGNLVNGVESIRRFRPEELEPSLSARNPEDGDTYVAARSVLEGADQFDAAFFGVYPKEAEVMDPQHRLFLESAWEALESAGYDPQVFPGLIGLYAGLSLNTYLLHNLASQPGLAERLTTSYPVGMYETLFGNDKDFMTTRVAYKLNLRGPCVTVQTACSTSLVAIVHAYFSLLTFQCDMALAGGVSITFPQNRDTPFKPDGMVSKDGTCRAFDADAGGTVFGSGLGIVVLKRLGDAIADGDQIRAVIKGAAINNDGSGRIGYAAPGVDGQAEVIALAHASAKVSADTISYVEAHGTGTALGDPIEVAALTQAFRRSTGATGFCALGTAKTHVGHLDMAAGVTGFIKTVLQLERELIPALLHFKKPNPKIDFTNTPFYPASRPIEWKRSVAPRRAGVSAFGVGGTNAHVVLEEAPLLQPSSGSRSHQLLLLSARTRTALEAVANNLATHLHQHPDLSLADVAFTLHKGRRDFRHRRMLVCREAAEAVASWRAGESKRVFTQDAGERKPAVIFMFPGQGAQYANMGLGLYREEPVYRDAIGQCAAILQTHLQLDLRTALYPRQGGQLQTDQPLRQTVLAQPCIFAVEYAMSKLWASWGVRPSAVIGHSVGEYVAAVLAGSLALEEALALIAARARLMEQLPGGSMLAVRLSEAEVCNLLNDRIGLAAVNGPTLTVVSGPTPDIESLECQLKDRSIACRLLETSHAFHSPMMNPVVEPFTGQAAKVPHHPPKIPWVSTCTGKELHLDDFKDGGYWGRQLREPVRFTGAIERLMEDPTGILLEVGPGQTLSTLAQHHPGRNREQIALASLQSSADEENDTHSMLGALGRLWISGVTVDWDGFYAGEKRRRVSLPTYPFERKRYWVAPGNVAPSGKVRLDGDAAGNPTPGEKKESIQADFGEAGKTSNTPMNNNTPTKQNGAGRKDDLTNKLLGLFRDLSGMEESQLSPNATFMELGFDSLFLTQASQTLQKKFKVKVSFRQMLDELSSIDALATHLVEVLPAESMPAAPAAEPAASTPATTSPQQPCSVSPPAKFAPPPTEATPADGSLIDRVLAQQMAIMQQQLELLRGGIPTGSRTSPMADVVPARISATPPVSAAGPCAANGVSHGARTSITRLGPFKGIEIGPKGALTPRQQKALAELTARYNRRTIGSKQYAEQHRFHFCDPRAAGNFRLLWKEMVYPIVCARSQGGKIWDVDGNEYVDVTLGFGANYFGHAPEFVVKAVEEQLRKGFEIGPQSPLAGEVARMLCAMTGMERATFCNTGSEAVMAAMRVARTVTARDKIVYFAGDYHGIFDEVLARAGMVDGKPGALPAALGIPPLPNIIVLEYGSDAALEVIRNRADEIAAVVVEPVQSRHPDLQPRDFLHALRRLTARTNIALIFDEVVTGFRAAPGGAQEYFDVRADLAIYGKVLGGGMPIGVLAGVRRFMDALDGGAWRYGDDSYPEVGVTFFAGTFVRHPLAMAAAHATLKHLQEAGGGLQRQVTERTSRMVRQLNDYFTAREVPIRLQSFSSAFYCDFHADLTYGGLLFYYLRDHGVHIWEGRVGHTCTAHSEEDLDQVVAAFKASVEEMQAGGFLPACDANHQDKPNAPAQEDQPDNCRVPLTEAQREIWIATQMGEDANCAYNESCSIHLHGSLDVPKLQQALDQVIGRHDALRCRFSPAGDYQEFAVQVPLQMQFRDLSALSLPDRAGQTAAVIKADMATPFDLVAGPLVRAHLLKQADDHHQFIFTTHHAVCDGWSFSCLFHELARFYSALIEARPCSPAPAMQFREFARWSGEQQSTPEFKLAEQFWVRKFEGTAIPVLDLPYDRPRPPLKTYRGSLAVRRCDSQVFESLKKVSGKMGNTVFGTLFSAFHVLLHRLSGQEDLVIGIPAAGQARVGSDDLVGHCLNFLPVRNTVSGGMPFDQFAAAIKRDVFDVYDQQDYTYGTLISKLKLPRDASRLPLVSVMFNIDKRGMDKLKFAGLKAVLATNPKEYVNFDLFLNLVQGDHELELECEFNTDLFDQETVDRWLGNFEALMRAIALDPRRPLDELELLTADERELLSRWNQTRVDYPGNVRLHELIEEQVQRTPGAEAVIFEDQQMTYQDLDQRANQLARHLKKLGVGPDTLVGICLDRSLEMVVGLLGILKAGGAYVPLDPEHPRERLAFMLQDSAISVLLTSARLASSLPPHQARVVRLDTDWPDIAKASPNPVAPAGSTSDLAYMIYTSGSTGRPKGALNTHAGIVNRLLWMQDTYRLTQNDRVMQKTPFSFDVSVWEFFWPLMTGAAIVLASPGMHKDGAYLAALVARHKITTIHFVPSMLDPFLEVPGLDVSCASLKRVICSGEALSVELQNRFCSCLPAELHNLYGPTEAAVDVTYWACDPHRPSRSVPIGRPIANTQIHILDRKLQPTPIGVPGELHIGGVGLARGYHNRPELTAEKFIASPFGDGRPDRLYKTGDLARFLADGTIEYLGRMDHQVKIRGFRIELGEIQCVLNEHPVVRESLVVVNEEPDGQKRLAAYVVCKDARGDTACAGTPAQKECPALAKELKAFAGTKLPDYMVPSFITILDEFPRLPNGKADRKALPAPSADLVADRARFVAPGNEKEKTLADIWTQVLGLKEVGVTDNFFELGGDSVQSFRVANRANQLGIRLTPRLILEHKTIASLVNALENGDQWALADAGPAITRVSRDAHRRQLSRI